MKPKSKSQPLAGPEFLVRRQAFDRYFERPMASSTFFDLVEGGKILAWPHMQGHYYLNRSLRQLGLPTVTALPEAARARSLEDIARLAFTLIDPRLFPAPSWLLTEDGISIVDAEHARRLANEHREKVEAQDHVELKLAYFQAVLDAQAMIEADGGCYAGEFSSQRSTRQEPLARSPSSRPDKSRHYRSIVGALSSVCKMSPLVGEMLYGVRATASTAGS